MDIERATVPARRRGMLERPGCRIHFEVTGSGPAIVFAHGLGGNHMSWWRQIGHFASDFTCVSFAHRGFAPSSAVTGGPDPADFADDLASLIAHLELPDVRIVAQSMGGWSAVEFALRGDDRLRGVVLAATTGSIDPQRLPASCQPGLAAWAAEAARGQSEMAARGVHPAAGLRMAEEQPELHLLYRHIDDMNAGLDKAALRRRLMVQRVRPPEDLAAVRCPVLMISNDEDMVIPPMAADGIAALVPGVRVAHIPEAGHSGYFERPAKFNELVRGFFAGM